MRALGGLLSSLMILFGFSEVARAGDVVKHSGFIASIAADERALVLAEVGPWHVCDGATMTVQRTITLTPETEFAIVARAEAAPSGFAGDFVEVQMGLASVFLTITSPSSAVTRASAKWRSR